MSRPLLVVIPQLGGSAALIAPFTARLRRRVDVHVVEPPGFGDSPSPKGIPSTRRLARLALEAWPPVDAPVHLFGISLGGMIAQWIAIDAPERVDRLILASTAARGLAASMHALAVARCLVGPAEDLSACLADEVLTTDDPATRERVDEATHAAARSRYDVAWLGAAAASHDTRDTLDGVRAETLVLTGGADEIIDEETQGKLADLLPHATWRVLRNASHDLTIDSPAKCAREVLAFLASAKRQKS